MSSKPFPFRELSEVQSKKFWEKVSKSTDDQCWNWTASTLPHGRGQVRINWICFVATRIAWFLTFKNDPYPLDVLHHCDNPACCNPKHLFLGTQKENMRDASEKCRHGKKLSPEEVRQILGQHRSGYKIRDIAKNFGVSETTVSYIGNGHTWKSITLQSH